MAMRVPAGTKTASKLWDWRSCSHWATSSLPPAMVLPSTKLPVSPVTLLVTLPASLTTEVVSALAAASAAVTLVAQQRGGAVSSLAKLGPWDRVANAVVAGAAYVAELFWPARRAAIYPYPIEGHPGWLHVDTGSNSGLDLAQPFVEEHDLLSNRVTTEAGDDGVELGRGPGRGRGSRYHQIMEDKASFLEYVRGLESNGGHPPRRGGGGGRRR